MNIRALFSGCLAASLLILSGCAGYRLGPVVPKYMAGVHKLAVPAFKNKTLIPRVETLAADAVIKHLQLDGSFRIVSEDSADAIVQGTVNQVRRFPARSARSDVLTTLEYNLTVNLDYRITRRSTGEPLANGSVDGNTSFFVSGNDVDQDERQALPLALEDAAAHIVTRVSEGW